MKELDQILDDCIEQILNGSSSVEECLERNPVEAAALEPLLRVGAELQCGRWMHVSPSIKSRLRGGLRRHMQAHPRRAAFSGLGNRSEAKSTAGFS